MKYIGIPSIIILCYFLGEMTKLLILKKKNNYKYIPVIVGTFGGILGILSYYFSPSIVFNVEEPILAIALGIVSGLASTGSYETIQKIIFNTNKERKK